MVSHVYVSIPMPSTLTDDDDSGELTIDDHDGHDDHGNGETMMLVI